MLKVMSLDSSNWLIKYNKYAYIMHVLAGVCMAQFKISHNEVDQT